MVRHEHEVGRFRASDLIGVAAQRIAEKTVVMEAPVIALVEISAAMGALDTPQRIGSLSDHCRWQRLDAAVRSMRVLSVPRIGYHWPACVLRCAFHNSEGTMAKKRKKAAAKKSARKKTAKKTTRRKKKKGLMSKLMG